MDKGIDEKKGTLINRNSLSEVEANDFYN